MTTPALSSAHVWLGQLDDKEYDHVVTLAEEYGPGFRHVARAFQITRNAPRQLNEEAS